MSPVTRYRRLRVRLWLEPGFKLLNESERLVAIYLLTGPQTSATGCYRLSAGSAAEDLTIPVQHFRRRLEAVLKAFGWRYEATSGLFWVPEWAEENAPANPNVCRSWRSAFDELPDSGLKVEALAATFAFLQSRGEAFAKAFGDPLVEPLNERFRNGSANTPDPAPEWPNRIGNDERRRANSEHTARVVEELQRRRSLA